MALPPLCRSDVSGSRSWISCRLCEGNELLIHEIQRRRRDEILSPRLRPDIAPQMRKQGVRLGFIEPYRRTSPHSATLLLLLADFIHGSSPLLLDLEQRTLHGNLRRMRVRVSLRQPDVIRLQIVE